MLKLKLQYFGHLMRRADSLEKILTLGKIAEKGMTEDKIVGWHHWHNGHEFEEAPGVGDGQGSLVWCNPWGHKKSDMTDWTELTECCGISFTFKTMNFLVMASFYGSFWFYWNWINSSIYLIFQCNFSVLTVFKYILWYFIFHLIKVIL